MDAAQFTLYIDESGNDLLYEVEQWEADASLETHCTLLGTVVPHNHKERLKDGLNQIKQDIFRTKEIVLHSVDIRFKRGAFVCFHYNPETYELFKGRMNSLVNDLRPTLKSLIFPVFSSVITSYILFMPIIKVINLIINILRS